MAHSAHGFEENSSLGLRAPFHCCDKSQDDKSTTGARQDARAMANIPTIPTRLVVVEEDEERDDAAVPGGDLVPSVEALAGEHHDTADVCLDRQSPEGFAGAVVLGLQKRKGSPATLVVIGSIQGNREGERRGVSMSLQRIHPIRVVPHNDGVMAAHIIRLRDDVRIQALQHREQPRL
eukprot:scaffold803_cov310-Pinguiococcus_pyrenoidosus.AAC.171